MFSNLDPHISLRIKELSIYKEIPAGTEILQLGQYVNLIPIVEKGLVKVFTHHEDKELLLYYIQPVESCVMSFSAALKGQKSKVNAITEVDSSLLILPVDQLKILLAEFPKLNDKFYEHYNQRYSELIDTIHQLIFTHLDQRILDFLKERSTLTGQNPLKISHKEIANNLGSAREVVSRLMKKLESEGKLLQLKDGIEIL
jgi:CRP/FNR family transcriptional regulator